MEERIIAELQALFAGESSGHDLFHTLRVTRTAQRIASQLPCDRELVTLGALLHDADDPKLSPRRITPTRGVFWPAAACRRNGSKR